MRELVYYVAASLDGFIAAPDGSFDAFPTDGDHMATILTEYSDALPTAAAEHFGIEQNRALFSTVLMGWNTYAVGLASDVTSPYRHLEQIVFSRTHHATHENLTTVDTDPHEVVRRLKGDAGNGIWLCGGGNLAAQLIDEIDRLIIKRNPIILGDGIPLFTPSVYEPRTFTLTASTPFDSGVVIDEYRRRH